MRVKINGGEINIPGANMMRLTENGEVQFINSHGSRLILSVPSMNHIVAVESDCNRSHAIKLLTKVVMGSKAMHSSYYEGEALKRLKRELRDFDANRKVWK